MFEEQLEFRGITLKELISYATGLNGIQVTGDFPIIIEGENWKIEVVEEQIKKITSTFKVNAVFIKFSSDNKETMEEIIKQYRKKTLRAGG